MKQNLFLVLAMIVCTGSVCAEDQIRGVQTKLKEGGFYHGEINGKYDSDTAAAVTRYQIRHGLAISGKLDGPTAKALGVGEAQTSAEPEAVSGTWRRLRNGDMQFKKLKAGEISPPKAPAASFPSPTPARVVRTQSVSKEPTRAERLESAPPDVYGEERLRDYVGAFVLAGLDPQVGAELEFFADKVNYFGEPEVDREKIRRDLLRYDARWPERRFWLDGELTVERATGRTLRVTFPLRYELRNGSKRSSGKVIKSLRLRKAGDGDLEIVGVNERKA